MIRFLKNLPYLIRILFLISKFQIITFPDKILLPKYIRFLGKLIALFTYPIGFFRAPSEEFGYRLTKFLQALGPIYIKLGQTLSTRPDLVGIEVVENLKSLQDSLPPFDTTIAIAKIEQTFKKNISDIFLKFDPVPVAAASIAQVYKATLLSGEEVAVKILRPEIIKKYNNDINLLEYIANFLVLWIEKYKRLRPKEVIDVFKDTMRQELNLQNEAAAASRLYDNFKGDDTLLVPQIFWQLTSPEIITLQWIDGISIYDTQAITKAGLKPEDIAAKIAVIFFNQAYRDGFFHGDLHPGNILVLKNGRIALVDFGIIGIISENDRLAIAEILYGFLKRDYHLVAKVHLRAGYIPAGTNLEFFAGSCRAIAEPIIGQKIKNISIGNLLSGLFRITEEFGMATQPQLLLLQKTMIVVEGIGHSLDPEINMWQLAEPWIAKWAAKNLTPEAKILRSIKKWIEKFIDTKLI
jgi:ubiquinone biosynthesis protein